MNVPRDAVKIETDSVNREGRAETAAIIQWLSMEIFVCLAALKPLTRLAEAKKESPLVILMK